MAGHFVVIPTIDDIDGNGPTMAEHSVKKSVIDLESLENLKTKRSSNHRHFDPSLSMTHSVSETAVISNMIVDD